jgi:hypothetical protein
VAYVDLLLNEPARPNARRFELKNVGLSVEAAPVRTGSDVRR